MGASGSGGGEPDVDYTYQAVTVSGNAKNVRLDKITYPNGREVYYNYATGEPGLGLSRLDNIASSGSPGESDKYAAYTHVGTSMVVKVAHPGVTNGLNLTYGTGGTYGGFDPASRPGRYAVARRGVYPPAVWWGRVIQQWWYDYGASDTRDKYTYGYDRNSNRLYC